MKRDFTKKDLHTGDIIENRAGERGVVILETDCIVYQAGGLNPARAKGRDRGTGNVGFTP